MKKLKEAKKCLKKIPLIKKTNIKSEFQFINLAKEI